MNAYLRGVRYPLLTVRTIDESHETPAVRVTTAPGKKQSLWVPQPGSQPAR